MVLSPVEAVVSKEALCAGGSYNSSLLSLPPEIHQLCDTAEGEGRLLRKVVEDLGVGPNRNGQKSSDPPATSRYEAKRAEVVAPTALGAQLSMIWGRLGDELLNWCMLRVHGMR